ATRPSNVLEFGMLIEVFIVPEASENSTKLLELFAELAPEEFRFGVKWDQESGLPVLLGDSIEALDTLIGLVRGKTNLQFGVGAPQVVYRETLSKRVSIKYTHKNVLGRMGQFAEVSIDFTPLERGAGFVFENHVPDHVVPKEFVPAVEKGIRAQ